MPHLYTCNVVLGTNDIHEMDNTIQRFEQFRMRAEGMDPHLHVRVLLWTPGSHSVFMLFEWTGDPGDERFRILAKLLLTELPPGVASFTTNQAFTTAELRQAIATPASPPPEYPSGA
jgi:hypothetical protein